MRWSLQFANSIVNCEDHFVRCASNSMLKCERFYFDGIKYQLLQSGGKYFFNKDCINDLHCYGHNNYSSELLRITV